MECAIQLLLKLLLTLSSNHLTRSGWLDDRRPAHDEVHAAACTKYTNLRKMHVKAGSPQWALFDLSMISYFPLL